jgi:hypothetical protein
MAKKWEGFGGGGDEDVRQEGSKLIWVDWRTGEEEEEGSTARITYVSSSSRPDTVPAQASHPCAEKS